MAEQCMAGMGAGKLFFSLLKLVKCQKGHLRQCPTNIVADFACTEIKNDLPLVTFVT